VPVSAAPYVALGRTRDSPAAEWGLLRTGSPVIALMAPPRRI